MTFSASFLQGLHTASTKVAAPPITPAPAAQDEKTWTLPGLCWNAPVTTSFGTLPVQVLRQHDPLRTASGEILRIVWFDKVQLDADFLSRFTDAQPIMISAGALGQKLPEQDVLVAPNQLVTCIQPGGQATRRKARDLLGRPGVMRQPQSVLTYYLFHCGAPADINCAGLQLHIAP